MPYLLLVFALGLFVLLVSSVCGSWKGLRKVGSDAGNLIGCCSFCLKFIIDRLIATLDHRNALATDLNALMSVHRVKSHIWFRI